MAHAMTDVPMDTADGAALSLARRQELVLIDAYWRAANFLSIGQIYLIDNPLLREPLRAEHVKPRLLGHWGTTLGWDPALRVSWRLGGCRPAAGAVCARRAPFVGAQACRARQV
jgi:hypothetical protein